MANEVKPEFPRDHSLKSLDLLGTELNHCARIHVNQVVVVPLCGRLVPRSTIPKLMSLKDAEFFETLHGPVDGREGDAIILLGHAAVQFGHIGMVVGAGNNLRDELALAREPEALGPDLSFNPVGHMH